MITFSLRTSLALFIVGIIAGFCSCLLFNGCGSELSTANSTIINPEVLIKRAAVNEASYQKKVTELEGKNISLRLDLEKVKGQLATIKVQATKKAAAIKRLTEPDGFSAKQLFEKIKATDSLQNVPSPCDSISRLASEFVTDTEVKDSLYEVEITTLDSMLALKDSIIQLKTGQNNESAKLLYQSIQSQTVLLSENKILKRQVKRHKLKNKLTSAGLIILSGIGVNYLLHH